LLDRAPVPAPQDWHHVLAQPVGEAAPETLRTRVTRHAPFGDPPWQHRLAQAGGLQSTLRPRGRPAAEK